MIMKYVYLQKKWDGCANNVWLSVDYTGKTYAKSITPFCDTSRPYVYELIRKSDIEKMIEELTRVGFAEIKS